MDSISGKFKNISIERNKYKQIPWQQSSYFILHGILLILLFKSLSMQAQEISHALISDYNNLFNRSIGLDENLINGYQYFNQYPKAEGHSFLGDDEFLPGKLVINNKTYSDVFIKFDILNQDVLLRYKNSVGSINHMVLQKNFISEFTIDDKKFKKLHFDETGTQFFQVLKSNKKIGCIYLWKKTLTVSSAPNKNYYNYSDANKTTYLVINGSLKRYKNKHSFVKLFPEELQDRIKKYLKHRKISLRAAPDKVN